MYWLQNFIGNSCYKKKFFKIKIDKIIHKINYVTRNIKWISYIIKNKRLTKLKYKNKLKESIFR